MPKDRKNAQENLPLPKKKKNWAIHIIDSAKKKGVEEEYLLCKKVRNILQREKGDIQVC